MHVHGGEVSTHHHVVLSGVNLGVNTRRSDELNNLLFALVSGYIQQLGHHTNIIEESTTSGCCVKRECIQYTVSSTPASAYPMSTRL